MIITDTRLKRYIFENTTGTIRSRANSILVENITYLEESETVIAKVKGSSRNHYTVQFYGLKTGMISSSCTCPFDYGVICKHEVATAYEIDAYMKNNDFLSAKKATINKTTPTSLKPSSTEPIELPFTSLDEITNSFFNKYLSTPARNAFFFRSFEFSETEKIENKIKILVNSYYDYDSSSISVTITKNKESTSFLCSCNALNNFMCIHQAKVLEYIKLEAPHLFFSEEELLLTKERLLKEYGHTLENENYKNYFEFGFDKKGMTLKHLKKGIAKISKYGDVNKKIVALIAPETKQLLELPYISKNKESKKEKGLAFACFLDTNRSYFPFGITPIKGNLNKEKTALSTKIEEIVIEDLLISNEKVVTENAELLKSVFKLSNESLNKFNKSVGHDKNTVEKYLLAEIKNVIPLLENQMVYEASEPFRFTKNNITPIKLSAESPELSFKVTEETVYYLLQAYVLFGGRKYKLTPNKGGKNILFMQDKDTYYLHKNLSYAKTIANFRNNAETRILKSDFEYHYKNLIQPLSKNYEVEIKHLKRKTKNVTTTEFKKQLYLSEVEDVILFRLVLEYNEKQIDVFSKETIEEEQKGTVFQIKRDVDFETNFIEEIRALHSDFESQDQSFFFLDKENFLKNIWFLNAFEILNEKKIEVFGFDKLSNIKYNPHKPNINMSVSSGLDWFDVGIDISFGKASVSLKDVRKSILDKSRYVQLKDGSIGILPDEWLEKYKHLFRSGEIKKDSISVSKYQFSVIDSLYDNLNQDDDLVKKHIAVREKLKSFDKIAQVKEPKGVKAKLRDYQKEGINWLNFLEEYNFGGCLADDMGLGKTLQVITFFKHLKDTKKVKIPHLVIVPTSLIFNWQEEIKKFCPSLKVLVLAGGGRAKSTKGFEKYDLVLSTYGIVLRDVDYLKEYTFNYIVLDESQAIKNPNSQRFKVVRLLKSTNKLVLTGTPIENNTFDLYAQMTFINPGLLGNMNHFKKEYATPIDKNKNTEIANELRQLINPFLLRRTKEQVATELPPKTEQVLYCTMETEQQKLYDAYRNKYRDYLLNKIEEDGLGKSKMYVLEGLTKLRQICDSPQLLNDEESYTSESIKIKELLRHITDKTGNHKILIFSQFVKMLNLIKGELENEKITYEYLDGRTKNRQEKVENFQNNENIRVFLISLKAGGTGLNLTAADYVYLVDPWWNPAVEAQAIDRCYRIGQNKKVMAYKMICKGTVEEKIVAHQLNKKQLSSDIIQTDESFVKSLSKESINELFG